MKNVFEEEKKFDSETLFFGKYFPTGYILGRGLQSITRLSEKVQCSRNQAIKNGLNEAILLMSINEALPVQDKTLCLSTNKNLILYESDSNFKRATSKKNHVKSLLKRKQAR